MLYDYVVAHLDSRYETEVRDELSIPSPDNCYLHLKTELVQQLSLSGDQKVCQPLHKEHGDHKPLHFLWCMRTPVGNTRFNDSLLRTIWLQRLP